MKKNKLLLFVFSAYANILGAQDTMQLESYWQQPIAAKESKTVLDYFMLLPREIVYCEAFFEDETFAQRKNFLTHVNTKNGYANNQVLEIALFKDRDNRKDIIAVQRGKSGEGNTCGAINVILEFLPEQKAWIYRDDLLPDETLLDKYITKYQKEYNSNLVSPYYKLPEFGLEI